MIKIQLCPEEELEDKYWYSVDLVLGISFLVFFAAAVFLLEMSVDADIARLNEEKDRGTKRVAQLEESTKKIQYLEGDVKELNQKIEALKEVSSSKQKRFKLLIAYEHLQTLRPKTVWFRTLSIKSDTFRLEGGSLETQEIAQFFLSLRETANQPVYKDDLRSLIYFKNLKIRKTQYVIGQESIFSDLRSFQSFDLEGSINHFDVAEAPRQEVTQR